MAECSLKKGRFAGRLRCKKTGKQRIAVFFRISKQASGPDLARGVSTQLGLVSGSDYLSLSKVCLKSNQKWTKSGEGLAFVFPRNGVGNLISRGTTRLLAPGDVLVMNAPVSSTLAAPTDHELEFRCFHLQAEHLFLLFDSHELCLLGNLLKKLGPGKWYPGSDAIARECHRLLEEVPSGVDLDHRVQLLKVAARVLSIEFRQAKRPRPGVGPVDGHLAQVLAELSADELMLSSIDALARRFCCSRRHLNRLFRQYFSCSAAALRMELRLAKAVCLLRDPEAKVISVAGECGFHHLGLFNSCFKRRFGCTPGQWRKMGAASGQNFNGPPGNQGRCPLRTSGFCPWARTYAERRSPGPINGHKRDVLPAADSVEAKIGIMSLGPALDVSAGNDFRNSEHRV